MRIIGAFEKKISQKELTEQMEKTSWWLEVQLGWACSRHTCSYSELVACVTLTSDCTLSGSIFFLGPWCGGLVEAPQWNYAGFEGTTFVTRCYMFSHIHANALKISSCEGQTSRHLLFLGIICAFPGYGMHPSISKFIFKLQYLLTYFPESSKKCQLDVMSAFVLAFGWGAAAGFKQGQTYRLYLYSPARKGGNKPLKYKTKQKPRKLILKEKFSPGMKTIKWYHTRPHVWNVSRRDECRTGWDAKHSYFLYWNFWTWCFFIGKQT